MKPPGTENQSLECAHTMRSALVITTSQSSPILALSSGFDRSDHAIDQSNDPVSSLRILLKLYLCILMLKKYSDNQILIGILIT